jgi:serine/threonine protein kinase
LSKNGIDGRKILNQDTAVRIVQQIVDGVKYLQSKNIVHRDIKPANILLGINGWKIADFGFSIISNT